MKTHDIEYRQWTEKDHVIERRKRQWHAPWAGGIFVLLLVQFLQLAQPVLVPVALAFVLTLVLQPLVRVLEQFHVARSLGAALVLGVVIAFVVFLSFRLTGPVQEWVSDVPRRISTIDAKVKNLVEPFEEVRKAIDGFTPAQGQQKNELPEIGSSFATDVLARTRTVVGHGVIVVILLFFLLASGDHFWAGLWYLCASWIDKNNFMRVVHNIESGLSAYLLTVTLINIGVGFLVGVGMFLIGMPTPVLWGALAACLNFVPYLGAMVGEIIVGLAALFFFEAASHALLAPLIYLAVAFFEGNFITPMILGRKFTIRPVLIIFSMIFFGWLWGTTGVFLAVPVLVLAGIVCENIPDLGNVGRFLRA